VKNYRTSCNHCAALYALKMADIRPHHMQAVIDACAASRIKILCGKLYIWCIRKEYLKKNYAEHLSLPKRAQGQERRAFSKKHIALLWHMAGANPNIPIALMLLYSGVRINELLDLKKADVNLAEKYFRVRASKTNAGIRIVPIADKVLPFWKAFMARSTRDYAICTPQGARMTYDNFKRNY
jgi:site-specific recombinase XerD